jgi:hypothetical protein
MPGLSGPMGAIHCLTRKIVLSAGWDNPVAENQTFAPDVQMILVVGLSAERSGNDTRRVATVRGNYAKRIFYRETKMASIEA